MAVKLEKSYFEVLGLCCASEVPLVEKILKPLHGVKQISVIVPTKTVIVVHDTLIISHLKIVEELNKARLEAIVRPQGGQGEKTFRDKWPAPSTMASGFLLLLSFLRYIYHPLKWLALGAVVIGLPTIVLRSIASIRNLTLNINILVLLAVGGTLALQDYWEAGTVVFLFSIAQWLESRASYRAMAAMSSLTSMSPQTATIAETGEQVDVNDVQVNTVIAVKAGDFIPIDGIVVEGNCEVDEKTLTGESFPVTKQLDSTVWAGTINLNGYISVKTSALAKDCVVARMAKLVEEAHNRKSRTQKFIDKCAKYYIPIVMLISAGFAVIPAALRVQNEKHWFHLAIVVLVSTCPCALILSTPVAIFCALSKAATTGLLVKGGDYLELLAKVKTVAFDKTGTITQGEFVVTDFQSMSDDISQSTLLYWVSSIESKSSHPMAAALTDYGRLRSIEPVPENVEDFQNFPGEGIYGKIDGKDIYIGNWRIGQRAGSTTDSTVTHAKEGKTYGYIYSGSTPVGVFNLSDACRSGAMEAIEELKSMGIRTAMLTGDSHAAAQLVQHQMDHALNIVQAELLPEDKARIIEDFKKEGPTVMVGDGVNDALALATADIGISMGISGSALAMETGDIILMSNDIQKIPKAIELARKTFRKLVENVVISVSTKVAILALAFAGYPLIWAAVLTDVGTCLVVILNSMLLLQETPKNGIGFSRSKYGTFSSTLFKKDKCTEPVTEKGAFVGAVKQCSNGCCNDVSRNFASPSLTSTRDDQGTIKADSQVGCVRWNNIHVVKCNDSCCKKYTPHIASQYVSQTDSGSRANQMTDAGDPLPVCFVKTNHCKDKKPASTVENTSRCCQKNCKTDTKKQGAVTINVASMASLVKSCIQSGDQCCHKRCQYEAASGGSISEIVIE